MDWVQFSGARQLLSEERVGKLIREAERGEDDEFSQAREQLTGRR